jgi:predicted Fe-Mo cluster-binding NifX family protein
MAAPTAEPEVAVAMRTVITVMNSQAGPTLRPFFGKCDGVLIVDGTANAIVFHPNPDRTAESLCELLLKIKPERLICGFVGAPELKKLRAAGTDVRLGSCIRTIVELIGSFHDLPRA